MLDPVLQHPPNPESSTSLKALMPSATAGQRAAAVALGSALAQKQPVILLFGEAGVGKTALINSFLATLDPEEFFLIQVSATSGEFAGPPSFDAVLDIMCRRLGGAQASGQRPATLATLAAAVGEIAREGRTVLLAIDQADHLTNNVIAEATRLRKYLAADAASFVCIFIGSPTLASRLDAALRRPGVAQPIPEIRVAPPSENELAALLAYDDTAQPGGPILTPGAIDRINVYAKSNLNWATPLADAARTLAANQGEREVTPELVKGALFELWPPEQTRPVESPTGPPPAAMASACSPDSTMMKPSAIDAIALGSPSGADAGVKAPFPSATDPASSVLTGQVLPDTAVSRRASIRRRTALWMALAASALLMAVGILAMTVVGLPDRVGPSPSLPPGPVLSEPGPPAVQSPPEPAQGEVETEASGEQPGQTTPVPAAPTAMPETSAPETPTLSGGEKPEVETPQSEADQTSAPKPTEPTVAPRPSRSDASPPAEVPAKKAPRPKASRQHSDRVTPGKWVQTR